MHAPFPSAMNIEEFRDYCLQKNGVTEEFPFDSDTLVFKVLGKMFALTDVNAFASINLKCDPEKAIELREQYSEVIPGYHMNKKHWNTVDMHGSLSDKLIKAWIDDSYKLVVNSLPAKTRKQISFDN
jgi:predicted DNA-binding protein (MmcQ/YjbR family)